MKIKLLIGLIINIGVMITRLDRIKLILKIQSKMSKCNHLFFFRPEGYKFGTGICIKCMNCFWNDEVIKNIKNHIHLYDQDGECIARKPESEIKNIKSNNIEDYICKHQLSQ